MRAGRGWGRRRSGQGKDVDGCGRGAGRARRSGREGGLKHREGRVMERGPLQVAWGSTHFGLVITTMSSTTIVSSWHMYRCLYTCHMFVCVF